MKTGTPRLCAAAVIGLAAAFATQAGEGRLEINQDCALGGCFPGDSAGFPVTISSSGSYVLVSNLRITTTNISAISVDASSAAHVDIDLNGHVIDGGGSCAGTPVSSCSGQRGRNGIDLVQPAGTDRTLLSVHNGSVRGFEAYGLALFATAAGGAPLASGSRFSQLTVTENGADGMAVEYENGTDLQFEDLRLIRNGSRGIGIMSAANGTAEFRRLHVHGNGGSGLAPLNGSSVVQSRFSSNGASGISCSGCTLAIGDSVFQGNVPQAYVIGTVRNMGGVVCIESACP